MKEFLIRHGETTGDVEDRFGGNYDDDLTEKGKRQSRNLAKKLEGQGIEKIFVSPLKRAQQTAKILSEALQVEVEIVKGIKERNRYGILTGLTKEEAEEKHPQAFQDVKDFKNTIEGAEDYQEFVERIVNAFDKLSKVNYGTVAVVTHGGPLSMIFKKILQVEWEKAEDCGYAVLEVKDNKIKILDFDGISFK